MFKFTILASAVALAVVLPKGAEAGAVPDRTHATGAMAHLVEIKGAKKDADARAERKAERKEARAERREKRRAEREARKSSREARPRNPKWNDEHAAFVDQARNTNSGIGNGGETPDFENGGWMSFPSESLDRDPANSRLQCQGGKNTNRC
ncbi:hypothetical protein [Tropicimonas sediminicola]|uniref:Uncharacterized protein n=1 Tax=Tropicimonas sediminicola TaxID=1031541 RepID=A0A239JJ24_9RHOB|nr:hypothetical protein [Tropicimonas sediminicola]SNT05837.1 hypothetical protein SAMN05421757_105309 [Tropicimonas sediminicola]